MSNPKIETGIDCSGDKIRTKQSFKKETDINTIMAKYYKTGSLSPEALAARQGTFADVSQIGDFLECQIQIQQAQAAFMTLTPDIRARFENQPAQLLNFMKDPKNREEAVKLGIIPKPATVATTKAAEAPAVAPKAEAKGTPTPPPPSSEGGVPVPSQNK